jgi:hypothetical protein
VKTLEEEEYPQYFKNVAQIEEEEDCGFKF